MKNREIKQILLIILSFIMYLIGKEYLKTHDIFDTINNQFGFYNWGLLMLLSSLGFSSSAYSIARNIASGEISIQNRVISALIFILLIVLSFSIIIEFFMMEIFNNPRIISLSAILVILGVLILIFRKEKA